jgi:Ca-activated chloride channel family protein
MALSGQTVSPSLLKFLEQKALQQEGTHPSDKRLSSRPLRNSFALWRLDERPKPQSSPRKARKDNPTSLMKNFTILSLVLSACFASAQSPETTINVDVKLVNVFVTVADEHGAPVAGLNKDNFVLREDGREQKISVFDKESELPLSIVLSIDTSLSTRKDLPLELASARRFAHTILRSVDGLALFQFSDVVDEVIPFTSDLKRIDRAIDRVRNGGGTAVFDAIYLGSQTLERRQGRKVMVIITDGGDTVSSVTYKDAVREAQQAEAIVYSIIIVPIEASAGRETGGEHALIQLSEDTGGRYYYATSTPQLDEAFRQISEELRTQYLLAYYPSQKLSESEFRRIKVSVTGDPSSGKYQIRHRTGYFSWKPSDK